MWYPNRTSIISDIKKVSGKNAKAVNYGRGIYKVHTTPTDSTGSTLTFEINDRKIKLAFPITIVCCKNVYLL